MIPEKAPPHRRILHSTDHPNGVHERITAVRLYYFVMCQGQFCVRRRTSKSYERHVEKLVYTRAGDAHRNAERLNKLFNTDDFQVFLVKEFHQHTRKNMAARRLNQFAAHYQRHKEIIKRKRLERLIARQPYWRIY